MDKISDILGGILSSEPETRVYTLDSLEEMAHIEDNRKLSYAAVLADVCDKYILVERLRNRTLNQDELRQEYIELDMVLSTELKKYGVPFKKVSVTFYDESAAPNYAAYKYFKENNPKPSALTVLMPFFLP